MSFYRRVLPHYQRDDIFHFLTFATYQRRSLDHVARSIILKSCLHDHETKHELASVVVMPDHVHMVTRPLVFVTATVGLEEITQTIKSVSAHRINRLLRRSGPVWQEESFDHVIRRGHFYEKVGYVLTNPERKGIVPNWRDYPWCWCAPELQGMF